MRAAPTFQLALRLSAVERVETTTATNSGLAKATTIACPSGKRLIGGGARVNPTNAAGVALSHSFPDNDNVYRAAAREIVATPGQWSLTAYAICAVAS